MAKILLGNLRGPKGNDGDVTPAALAAVSAAESAALVATMKAAEVVAAAASVPSAESINAQIATAVEPLTSTSLAEFTRKARAGENITVAIAGDSTGDSNAEWFVKSWDLETMANGLGETLKVWSDATSTYTTTDRRTAVATSFGVRPVQDNFTRTAASLVGSTPPRGGTWSGAAGSFSVDGTAAAWAASSGFVTSSSGTMPASTKRVASGSVTINTTPGAGNNQLDVGMSTPSVNNSRISLYMRVTAGGTITWGVQAQFPTFATVVVGGGTPLAASTLQTVDYSLTVEGTAVTAVLNGVTATATLSAGDATAAAGMTSAYMLPAGTLTGWKVNDIAVDLTYAKAKPRITVINASFAGTTLQYQLDRLSAMFDSGVVGTIDALFVSSSHNYNATLPADYLTAVDAFVTAYKVKQPTSAVVLVAQNPECPPATHHLVHRERLVALGKLAETKGYGYLNALAAFEAVPDWQKTLVRADGVHPTASGTFDDLTDPLNGSYVWGTAARDWYTALIS